MEGLPPEVLAHMSLDQGTLCSMALVSKALRTSVKATWAYQTITLTLRHLDAMKALNPTGVCLCGVPHTMEVPRDFGWPSLLRSLKVLGVRNLDSAFWTRVFEACPAMTSIGVCILEHDENVAVEGVNCLMRLGAEGLEDLEIRWERRSPYMVPVPEVQSFEFKKLKRLAIKGPCFLCPSIDSPVLVSCDLDDAILGRWVKSGRGGTKPKRKVHHRVTALSPRVHSTLKDLTWSTVTARLPFPPTLTALTSLDVTMRDIGHEEAFDSCLRSLRVLPDTVVRLRVALLFSDDLNLACPMLDYDVDVLGHLRRLADLEIVVAFATPGCGVLVEKALGAPPSSLRLLKFEAMRQATTALGQVLDEYDDENMDPNDSEYEDLQVMLESVDQACQIRGMEACRNRFSNAFVTVTGCFVISNGSRFRLLPCTQ